MINTKMSTLNRIVKLDIRLRLAPAGAAETGGFGGRSDGRSRPF